MRAALASLLLLSACARTAPPDDAPQVTLGDANAALFVVALHGRGDTPEAFARAWQPLAEFAEVWVPRAPLPFGPGAQWFDAPRGLTHESAAAPIAAAEAALWPELVRRAHGRRVVVLGFSQGAVMSYALAAQHPKELAEAIPLAGLLPPSLSPAGESAPVVAFHGTDDARIDVALGRETIARFEKTGPTRWTELPGVGHTIPPALRQRVIDEVRRVAERR